MLGPLMPEILSRYGLNLAAGSGVVSIQNISGLIAVVVCGLFGDRWNKYSYLGLGALMFVLSLLGTPLAPTYSILLAIFFVFGMGSRGLDALSNAVISDVHGDRRSLFLNLLHTFFGIGAFLGPMFVYFSLNNGMEWNRTFFFLGIIAFLFFLAYLFVVIRGRKNNELSSGSGTAKTGTGNPTGSGLAYVFARGRMWVLGLLMFLHMGVLGVLITWLPLFAGKSAGAGGFLSSFTLSALWVGIIFSRLLLSRLAGRFGEILLIRWGAVIPLLLYVPAIVIGNPVLLAVSAFFTGLLAGYTIPFLVSVGCGWFPEKSAAVTSMLFVFGYLSVGLYPRISGMLGDSYGLAAAMLLVAASQIVLFGISWLLPGRERRAG
jgi:fucose permease